MKTENLEKIVSFFNEIYRNGNEHYNCVNDFIDFSEMEIDELSYDNLYDLLSDKGFFDIEIIYYSVAMAYLSENDNSLHGCMEIASELGFSVSDLNSEILASLLAGENFRNDFSDYQSDINDLFQEITESEEEE